MKRVVGLGMVVVGGFLLTSGVAMAAPGGYGPTSPTGPAGTPGGFSTVAASQTVGPAGGSVRAVVAGGQVAVSVPAGAFTDPVQVEVTSPDLSAVTPAALSASGFSGFTAVAGLGVKVLDATGQPMTGTFAKSLDVTITGDGVGVAGEKVLMLSGPSSASVVDSTVGPGSIVAHLSQDPDLVVVNPVSARAGAVSPPIPGATAQPTGKPFAGETVAAGAMFLGGAGLLASRWRRQRS